MAPNSSDHQLTNHLSWRAGCGENRTSGSAGGLGKRTQEQSRHRAPSRPNWRHTRGGDKYVTVIIDLTPVQDKTGPARLLDMIEGRSKAAFKAWLAGLSSFLCKWCGLQVGVDAFGVGQGELLEGLFPVGGHGSLDESPRGSSLVGW